ncbi:MAG: glycosyltransferase family 2 protein [Anaerolineaceae bacterium]
MSAPVDTPSQPHVAILTVTTNAAGHLGAYFDALDRVTYRNRSLWIVDNASADGSANLVAQRQPAASIFVNDSNLGFTGACNRGLEAILADGRADYVLFLNDDTEVRPGFLEPLAALAGPKTMVAPATLLSGSPGMLDDSAGDFDWWRGTWKTKTLGLPAAVAGSYPHAVEVANLSCLLVPIAAVRDVGLLDDQFFVYYDDTDFCRRARNRGYRIILEPASQVDHLKGATLGGQLSPFGCYYLTRNRPYLIWKHGGRIRFAVFSVYFLGTRVARMALWARSGRRDLVRATLAGLRDFGLRRMGPGRPPGR